MLAYHCPECGIPLFKYEGRVICPACKREADIIGDGSDVMIKMKDEVPKDTKDVREESKDVHTLDAENAIMETIRILANRLKDVSKTEDIGVLKEYTTVLKELLDILIKLKNIII